MERYNIFLLIHKGLRAALYQTALQLQQTDFITEEETEMALNRVKEIVMLFDGHAHKEDCYILPAVQAYEPSVVTAFEDEHVKDEALGRHLHACIEKVEQASTTAEKMKAGATLSDAFVAFTSFNLQHMAKEEDILNKILWRYYSDDEIKGIGRELSKNVEPWIQNYYATWMLRGINNSEATTWMQAIQKGMPAVIFQTLLQKAEEELPAQRFRTITESLTEGLQVA